MLDSDDFTFPLDGLFFERPVVLKAKPPCQEPSPWKLDVPPSLSQIPTTQDIQNEAETFASSNSFSQKSKKYLPPFKLSAGSTVFTTKISGSQSFDRIEEEVEGSPGSTSGCGNLGGDEGFVDSSKGRAETPLYSGHAVVSRRCLALDFSQSPPLRRSLFKASRGQVLIGKGDSSNTNDLSNIGSGSIQATSRSKTLPSQVTMVTVPPPSLQPPPPATASQSTLPPPPKPHFSLPCVGSSAASGRPSQQAAQAEMQDKGTKRAHVLPMTPQPLHLQGSSRSGILRPVSEISAKFRSIFREFPFFNYVQSKALDDVLYTGKNFVACAPTGSGKTVLFELAIVRLLMETSEPWRDIKTIYMAPIKALCSQRLENWKQKFGPLGLRCKELTGDTEIDDFFEIINAHIIMTTPEKWDSITRKWKSLLQQVRLFLIDEIHVVRDTTRGATLEVVVSRMKAVQNHRMAENLQTDPSMRVLAVSATIPNVADIADWLCNESGPATYVDMDESYRPVTLRKVVLGFPHSPNQTEFKFDLSLNYKMANIIQTYSDQRPTLVFCSTRKGVQQSATVLAKEASFIMSIEHKQRLMKYANSILDSKLRELVMHGVGYHHAGVDMSDRKMVEEAFTLGDLPVLFTTSTLAIGVNLPAHLVVVKSTMHYVAGSCEEYSEADILQMIGRAGRPQFDTSATAVIMTKVQTKDKYMKLMNGMEIIESSLHGHLVEHLNAEIVLQTISNVNMAVDWIRSTFLYIRALKNPKHYGFPIDLDRCGIEAKLQELCLKNLNSLSSIGLITMDEDVNIKPTEAGRLMARYCVAFDTMKQFRTLTGSETLTDLVELVSKSKEFSDVHLRMNEKRTLNTLNKDKNRITIRFPMEGKIRNKEMKVNCLIQTQLGSIPIQEFGLIQDTAKIFTILTRISKCLSEFLGQCSKTGFTAILSSLILAKCVRAKLWENSPYVSKQLEKIGLTLSTAMVNAGLTTFNKIEEINARELELIVNRHPPFGNQIKESVINLPKYEVSLEQLPRYSCATAEIVLTVNLKNQEQLLSKRTAPDHHYVTIIVGDSDNNVVFLQKLTDMVLLKSGSWSKKIEVARALKGEEISVNLISSEYVGLDIQQMFNVYYSGLRKFGAESMGPTQQTDWDKIPYNPSGQRNQPSTTKSQSTQKTVPQKRNATSITVQDKRQCNHFCKNKELCAHDCCKLGVQVVLKRPVYQDSAFSSHLRDLKSRRDTLLETPVKRLKMKINGEPVSMNLQQFSYKSKEGLPVLFRDGGNQYMSSVRPHTESVDLIGDDCAVLQHIADQEELDYVPHETTVNSNNVSTSQIPSVNFDLGNEWDDWDDFDENLVHASETSMSSCAPKAKVQQSDDYSMLEGNTTQSPPLGLSHVQSEPCFSMANTSQREVGDYTLTMQLPNRLTTPLNNKRQSIFSRFMMKEPESLLENTETSTAPLTGRFDFFSKQSIPTSDRLSGNSSVNPPTPGVTTQDKPTEEAGDGGVTARKGKRLMMMPTPPAPLSRLTGPASSGGNGRLGLSDALLSYKASPLQCGLSPAELLMKRKLRTTLPSHPNNKLRQKKPSKLEHKLR
ncbi:probable ATP-dependent DNA helicase HFM1 [Lampris incognitus]|uniref:probable ATP-dependent DNA helicase HFM1 n=1 Tax=Lampris incognitus TaxID=2546036 RepID=UPI0024B56B97|nr:probable ATP-dependent DNA helicase HFM1 [Lampris incognitus]